MTRIGCSPWFARSSSATEAADNGLREGDGASGQAGEQGGQRLQAGGALSGLRRSVVSAFGGGHRPRVTLPTQMGKDKGKAKALGSSSSLPSSPKPRSAYEVSRHGHDGASTSASAQRHYTLGELMNQERETDLTRDYMARMHRAVPRKPTVQWAPDTLDFDRADKVKGQFRSQHPPVSRHKCTDPEQIAINEQLGRNKRYEKVYGAGSLPIEDDDATGEPLNGPARAAPRTMGPAAAMLAQAGIGQESDSEDSGSEYSSSEFSGSEFSVSGYSTEG